jgi:hypothetical protein
LSSSSRTGSERTPRTGSATERGVDVARRRALRAPVDQRVGGHLRAVVTADVCRGATHGDQSLEHLEGRIGGDAAGRVHDQRLPGELVDDVQQLQRLAVGGLVELEVERPHVVGGAARAGVAWARWRRRAAALAGAPRDLQTFLPPDALHALAVDLLALLLQVGVRLAVPPPRTPGRERATRRATSSSPAGLGSLRCVERCCPTTW